MRLAGLHQASRWIVCLDSQERDVFLCAGEQAHRLVKWITRFVLSMLFVMSNHSRKDRVPTRTSTALYECARVREPDLEREEVVFHSLELDGDEAVVARGLHCRDAAGHVDLAVPDDRAAEICSTA